MEPPKGRKPELRLEPEVHFLQFAAFLVLPRPSGQARRVRETCDSW